jgi:hypothetical protein
MLALCKSQPNWIPKKPTLMLMIWAIVNLGFSNIVFNVIISGLVLTAKDTEKRNAEHAKLGAYT